MTVMLERYYQRPVNEGYAKCDQVYADETMQTVQKMTALFGCHSDTHALLERWFFADVEQNVEDRREERGDSPYVKKRKRS